MMNKSCRIRAVDFEQQWLKDRARELCLSFRVHRKLWEFAVIAQVYHERFNGQLVSVSSLGFGVGKEPMPAWLAACGSYVVASDSPDDTGNWANTNQRLIQLSDMPWLGICSKSQCSQIDFQQIDMNHIPPYLLAGSFDFTWSCGSFEHIGSIDKSLLFFCQQMRALKPGGIAAHTTEFNPVDGDETLNEPNLCLFRERDLRRLESMLASQGDNLWALDLNAGNTDADEVVDTLPYTGDIHLSIKIGCWTTTSILLVAERGAD